MSAKKMKVNRLFAPESGKSVVIAVDHGFYMGNLQGLEAPVAMVKKLIESQVDGVLLSFGIGKATVNLFGNKINPSRILAIDHALMYSIPGQQGGVLEHSLFVGVEEALRWGFDAVKCLLVFGLDRETQRRNFNNIGKLVAECDRMAMPLMIEPFPWGYDMPEGKAADPELIVHCCRIALECGADILKVPYTGDVKSFRKIISQSSVPVLILGGPKIDNVQRMLKMVKNATKAGGRGVVFGRNIWGHKNIKSLIEALKEVIHSGASVKSIVQKHALGD
ncbi:MAG: fructose-bisphosphate aldolase [Deltaproteobacteria bacterium]|nr:fructose-bisphosphate aldolase [Deltaproteobacteria bacterium]